MKEVEKEPLYLCLSVAALMKDRIEEQKKENEKMKRNLR